MREQRLELTSSELLGRGTDAELLAQLAPFVERAALEQRVLAERVEVGERAVWLKGDHLPGKARWRHSLRRAFGGSSPREREFANLEWLRKRLFRAPKPLAAGVVRRGVVITYQFVALELLGPHADLESALPDAPPAQRTQWLAELAREIARLHALHFVHRDLHLRNVLAATTPEPEVGDARRLTFIDVARGGNPRLRRNADFDLGTLMLDAADLLSLEEQRAFFALYLAEREHQSRAVDAHSLLRHANQRRDELLQRIEREPGRWRRSTPPAREWNWRALLER